MSVIQVVAAIIIKDQQVLIARRPLDKHQGGYWEFPGGKIDGNELPEQALQREINEELDINITAPSIFTKVDFDYPEKRVQLYFYKVSQFSGEPKGMEGQPIKWVALNELMEYEFPQANRPVVELLLAEL